MLTPARAAPFAALASTSQAPAPPPVVAAPLAAAPVVPPLRRGPIIPWTVGRSNTLSCDNPAVAACHRGAEVATAPVRGPLQGKDVDYTVTIPDPASGYIDVTMRVPTEGKNPLLLSMARWAPGSYSMRDFAKNVDSNVSVTDDHGAPLAFTRPDTTMWSIDPKGAKEVTVRYRVFAHEEQSTSANWVEPGLALINGAATFMTIAGDDRNRGCKVTIDAPAFGGEPATSLGQTDKPNTFRAMSYDALVDAPIALGDSARRQITVDGVTYTLATFGGDKVWDSDKAAKALKPILEQVHKLWQVVPFDDYVFLNVLNETYGGLEHLSSTTLMSSRWSMQNDPAKWLTLACHELLHAWNVKRMRPKELGPFDYTRMNATPSLWVAEGLTEYYANLLVRRSGATSAEALLERLGTVLNLTECSHGHTVQSLAMSSMESFTKFYHPTENAPNAQISYYIKGALVGLLLDIEIRKVTSGAKSLDDVMRLAYGRYSGEQGYTPQEWEACASEVAGVNLTPWFDAMVRSTAEPPIAESLATIGLRLKSQTASSDAYLGAETSLQGHRTVVKRVATGSPAAKAGIMPGDEIISIGEYRVAPGEIDASIAHYKAGESYPVEVARRDKMVRLSLTFGEKPAPFAIELDPNASADALVLRKGWLGV